MEPATDPLRYMVSNTLSPEIFSRVDFVVANALKNGLVVMVNNHHFDRLDENPTNSLPEFLAIWRQITEHYKGFPKNLVFDLHNEPHQNATTEAMNSIYASVSRVLGK
jgi:endoglucanase